MFGKKKGAAQTPVKGAAVQAQWHRQEPGATQLVVVVKGLGSSAYIQDVVKAVADQFPKASILTPAFDSSLYSNLEIRNLITSLTFIIDQALQPKQDQPSFDDLILIGHSIGALAVRGVYLRSRGKDLFKGDDPGAGHGWPVSRIVMLAGINAGWHAPPRKRVGLLRCLVFRWMIWAARRRKDTRFMLSTHADSPFVADLRCRWLDLVREELSGGSKIPQVIQIKGTEDGLIADEDTDDLLGSQTFHQISVPDTEHFNVGIFQGATSEAIAEDEKQKGKFLFRWLTRERIRDDEVYGRRKAIFLQALTQQHAPADPNKRGVDIATKDVAWILHGIRDFGHWAAELKQYLEATHQMPASVSGFGLVSLLGFAVPGLRRRKLPRFLHAYTTIRAKYPNATVHFCGHSFGTYLFCKTLTQQTAPWFGRVAFAGSVVYRDFDWDEHLQKQRVLKVLNYIGSADWIVALLPGYFERLPFPPMVGYRDLLGSGGFEGFTKGVTNDLYVVDGGHSAALIKANFPSIGGFLSGGKSLPPENRTPGVSGLVRFLSSANVVMLPLIIAALVVIGYWAWQVNAWAGGGYTALLLFVLIWI